MIKVEELQIGDWVLLNGSPCKVIELHEHSVLLQGRNFAVSEVDIEPIPITEDFFYRIGWKEGAFSALHEQYMQGIDIRAGYARVRLFAQRRWVLRISLFTSKTMQMECDIQYVHELQRALKLCGLDSNIKMI